MCPCNSKLWLKQYNSSTPAARKYTNKQREPQLAALCSAVVEVQQPVTQPIRVDQHTLQHCCTRMCAQLHACRSMHGVCVTLAGSARKGVQNACMASHLAKSLCVFGISEGSRCILTSIQEPLLHTTQYCTLHSTPGHRTAAAAGVLGKHFKSS